MDIYNIYTHTYMYNGSKLINKNGGEVKIDRGCYEI